MNSEQIQEQIFNTIRRLERRGVRFDRVRKEADASRLDVVGIKTLGRLDFLNGQGYTIFLPAVDKRPSSGYRGLEGPMPRRRNLYSFLEIR